MPHESSIRKTQVLLSGLGMGESPRWHDGRLWCHVMSRRRISAPPTAIANMA
jgi:hypothetical protein